MLGKPKFKHGDKVRFKVADKEKVGSIYIIDKWGTFFDKSDVCWTGNSYENTGELFLSPLWNIDDKGHFQYLNEVFGNEIGEEDTPYVLPAWSLHRLLEIIPQSIGIDHRYFDLEADAYSIIYHYSFVSEDGEGFEDSVGPINTPFRDNIYDDIIDNIEWLISGGYFNKEYLEE